MSRTNDAEPSAHEDEATRRERLHKMFDVPDGHAGVVASIALMLHGKSVHEAFDCPPIVHYLSGMALPAPQADFVFFHEDGSATVVQAAAGGTDLEILSALGPLKYFALRVAREWTSGKVRRVLAAGIAGEGNEHLLAACAVSNVLFVPIGTNEEHRAIGGAALARLLP